MSSQQRYERVRLLLLSGPLSITNTMPNVLNIDSYNHQVSNNDHEDTPMTPSSPQDQHSNPSSPPPSFRSRTSSPSSRHLLSHEDPITTDAERTLADTFDDGSDSDNEGNNDGDDRQRLMRSNTTQSATQSRVVHDGNRPNIQRMVTQFPPSAAPVALDVPTRPYTGNTPYSSFSHSNDGVFANLDAKPERGEKTEELPPVSLLDM